MKKQKSGDHLITPMVVRVSALDNLEVILELLDRPTGFARLTADQRKYLLGVTLAAVVPADLKIRHTEVGHLQKLIISRLACPTSMAEDILSLACNKPQPSHISEKFAKALPDLLGPEDLAGFVGNLWELAIVDKDLHASEERLVFQVADIAGVPRKRVAEQLARAQSRMN